MSRAKRWMEAEVWKAVLDEALGELEGLAIGDALDKVLGNALREAAAELLGLAGA